jgi:hypothetical protein
MHKEMPIGKIQEIIMQKQEQLDMAKEIAEAISAPIMANDFDDDDDEVLNFLALLVQKEAIIQLNNLILTLKTIIAFSSVFYRLFEIVIAKQDGSPKVHTVTQRGRGGGSCLRQKK